MTKLPQGHMGYHSVACHSTIYATEAIFAFRFRSREILLQTLAADIHMEAQKSAFRCEYILNGGEIQNSPRRRKLYCDNPLNDTIHDHVAMTT